MTVYFVTGKLGGGKTLSTVGRIRDYMKQKRKIATNLDIYPHKILNHRNKQTITRLPDKPRIQDFEMIGKGSDSEEYNENNFGLIVLDEMGTWFNSRNWNDPERLKLLDWFLHARKLAWDILFVVQSVDIIDKQLRETLCEHLVICRRLDRVSIPFLSSITRTFIGRSIFLPKIHRATVHYGDNEQAPKVDKWTYLGADLYDGYDTRQVFRNDNLYVKGQEEPIDFRTSYTVLSAWHMYGRYMPTLYERTMQALSHVTAKVLYLVAIAMLGLAGRSLAAPSRTKKPIKSYLVSTLCDEYPPYRL